MWLVQDAGKLKVVETGNAQTLGSRVSRRC